MKLDGHDPEKTIFVLACGEPMGALTIDATLRLAAGGGGGGSPLLTTRWAIAWRSVRPPVPPLKPR